MVLRYVIHATGTRSTLKGQVAAEWWQRNVSGNIQWQHERTTWKWTFLITFCGTDREKVVLESNESLLMRIGVMESKSHRTL